MHSEVAEVLYFFPFSHFWFGLGLSLYFFLSLSLSLLCRLSRSFFSGSGNALCSFSWGERGSLPSSNAEAGSTALLRSRA